jgi:hypothetical protein
MEPRFGICPKMVPSAEKAAEAVRPIAAGFRSPNGRAVLLPCRHPPIANAHSVADRLVLARNRERGARPGVALRCSVRSSD